MKKPKCPSSITHSVKLLKHIADYWLYNLQNKTIYKYIANFFKYIAGCTTRNVKIQNLFKMYCRLYNPQCKNFKKRIAGSTTRNVFQNFYTMSYRRRTFWSFYYVQNGNFEKL